MAQRTKSQRSKSRSNGRSASEKPEKYRFAENVGGRATVAEHEYRHYAKSHLDELGDDPDVLLDVPVVKVDKIYLKVEDLQAQVSLNAQVLDLVQLDVGVDVRLGKLEIDIEGVEAQALLKVRLDHVAAIVDRVMTTIDRNPKLVESLGHAIEDIGSGAGDLVGEAGEAVEDVGEGAEQTLPEVGQGAGQAVGELGQGAGQAVGQIGEGAGQAVGDIGQGAGQAVGDVGQGAGEAASNIDQLAGNLGQTVGELGQGAGQAVGGLGQGAGQAMGGLSGGGGRQLLAAPKAAKDAAKNVAKTVAGELGATASEEAKHLEQAATRKVKGIAEKRRQRREEKHPATDAAKQLAQQAGIDIGGIKGSGKQGRVTVGDVKKAAGAQ